MSDSGEPSSFTPQRDGLLQITSDIVRRLRQEIAWQPALGNMLAELGKATGASRCVVCQLQPVDSQNSAIRVHCEWCGEGTSPSQIDETTIPYPADAVQQSTDWVSLSGGTRVNAAKGFPVLQCSHVGSLDEHFIIYVPIRVDNQFWGWVGMEDSGDSLELTPAAPAAVHLIADGLGAVIEQEQTELEQSRLNAMFEHSEDAIIGKTLDGTVTQWNGSAERIYGYTADEMIGNSITQLIPDDRIDEFHDIMNRLRSGQRIEHHQTRRLRKDGRELIVSLSISPIIDREQNIAGALTIARDITDQMWSALELQASEQRLKLALEAGSIGAWDWNTRTNEVIWSPNMELLHGMDPGTFDGTFEGYRASIHSEDYDQVIGAIQQALQGSNELKLEYRSRRADGTYQWLETHGTVLRDSRGSPLRMTGVCFDVTERKKAEAAKVELLAQVQRARTKADAEVARLRDLIEHAPAMMALLEGPDHVFVLANERYLTAVGHRDVLNRPVLEALPELADQGLIEMLDTVYESGETITRAELPVMIDFSGDGSTEERFYSFAYQPFRDLQNRVTGVLVHAVDLTDHVRSRQRVEQLAKAVASERDRLQQMIDVMPEGVAICDADGVMSLSNRAAHEIWGQDRPHGGFESYEILRPMTLDLVDYPIEELPLTRSVRSGETVLGEQMIIRNARTGEDISVLANSAPLRAESGEITGGVVVFQDIRPLLEVERQKEEFLQSITHDLKNPLTTILGNAQLLQRLEESSAGRSGAAASNIEYAGRRALSLVDEILDLTRLQMGHSLEMSYVSVSLPELAVQVAEQLQPTTDKHSIALDILNDDVVGQWDAVRIERVVANLVSNAINYSPGGGQITVRVRREVQNDRATGVLEIEDRGLGIPAHEMPRLFERFWRGSNVREQVPGTGLGLAGAKAIVEAHGGEIRVDSTEGQGSTFAVHLPLVEAACGAQVS